MNHRYKTGNAIKDDHIKRVKKLLNRKKIIFQAIVWGRKIEFEISNVRKYENRWVREKKTYCYEVDVKLKSYDRWAARNYTRRFNNRIRTWQNERILLEELEFFNVNDICISKISYE